MTRAVRCENLTVTYGDVIAVDGISFDVRPGEVFGLLGPNGAGKTSVVRALTTIIDPAGGEIEVAGVSLSDPDAVRARIGVLPESNGYPNAETAFDYLRFFGQLYGMTATDADARTMALLGTFGLTNNARQLISTFSRGMRQRLGIARALINRPQVLFLDEPTLGLDPAGREVMLSHLTSSVAANGTSIVLCSHLLDDVERICDRVAILDRGRIVADGSVAEVIESAGVGGSARILVAPEMAHETAHRLQSLDRVARAQPSTTRPGTIDIQLSESDPHANQLLQVVLESGVDIRGVELQGARLSEAFLELTGRSR